MTHFAAPLKKDLSLANFAFLEEGKEKMFVVMGRVIDAVDTAALTIPVEKDLTLVEELQHFRTSLNAHLDWEYWMELVTVEELAQLRKIVNGLTETDHLHLISFS
jgi:hypothetical protein